MQHLICSTSSASKRRIFWFQCTYFSSQHWFLHMDDMRGVGDRQVVLEQMGSLEQTGMAFARPQMEG